MRAGWDRDRERDRTKSASETGPTECARETGPGPRARARIRARRDRSCRRLFHPAVYLELVLDGGASKEDQALLDGRTDLGDAVRPVANRLVGLLVRHHKLFKLGALHCPGRKWKKNRTGREVGRVSGTG